MFKKITLVASLMTVVALSQSSIAHADSVADEINSTNELSQQIENQAQQPQPVVNGSNDDANEVNKANALAGEIENQARQPQAVVSGSNDDANEVNKANALAGEIENQVQPTQSVVSGSNDDANEVKKANALAGETEKYVRETPPVDSVSSSSSFVTGAVRESNRIASEVERNNADLMQKSRQTTDVLGSGSSNERPSSYNSAVSTQPSSSSGTSNSSSLIPIGVGIVAIGGVCWLVSSKKAE